MKKFFSIALAFLLVLSLSAALADSKVYTIVTDTAFRPFEYADENGNMVGIDVDILAAVAADQGFEYTLTALGWDASIAACQAGQADGMIAGASITQARKDNGWIFSDGYYSATQSMAVAAGAKIAGFDDLAGKTVAVKIGTQSAEYAESLKDQFGFSVIYLESSPDVYQSVIGGQAAACFDDTPILADYIKSNGVPLQLVEGTANEGADYGFAVFSPNMQELVDLFNAGLANIKANGTYKEILIKHLGEDAAQ